MKKTIVILTILIFLLSFSRVFAQTEITKDTTLANKYVDIAVNHIESFQFDSVNIYLDQAQQLYLKHLGENNAKYANVLHQKGISSYSTAQYDLALSYYFHALQIYKKLFGESHSKLATLYNNIANVFYEKVEYDSAMGYHFQSMQILKNLFGEDHPSVATSYNNIGNVYSCKNENDSALIYHHKSLAIKKRIFGDKNAKTAASYNNIGAVYFNKGEYNLALEYYFKDLQTTIDLLGENNNDVAASYYNIGFAYHNNNELSLALKYYFKSLQISIRLLGEKNPDVAQCYNNIGDVYLIKGELDSAFEYYSKGMKIYKEIFGEEHTTIELSYYNIGMFYQLRKDYGKALDYYFQSLEIRKKLTGEKHVNASQTYNRIGQSYLLIKDYSKALKYFQKGIASCLRDFNDTVNVTSVPVIENYLYWKHLLEALQAKAQILADTSAKITESKDLSDSQSRLQLALRHYQASDTLLEKTRKEISGQSDKLSLGELSSAIYEKAIDVCNKLKEKSVRLEDKNKYKELSFFFSEKNKASVLLESLSGQQALQFAGIPDSLLAKEHNLRIDVNFYNKQLADMPDSAKQVLYRDRLFSLNRSYDSLIAVFETKYPDYYNLKYNESTATVSDVQKQLDESTALVSYFAGDSMITIFTITRNTFDIEQKLTPKDFTVKIDSYRRSLSRISVPGQRNYKKLAAEFYDLLIPKKPGKKIKHLIIVPDHALATIPFETFLTKPVTDKSEMHKLPYLINQYAVSYSYSATLFMKTFPKEKTKEIEIHDLNDWLAFAPVADTSQTGMSLASRELLQRYQNLSSDSVQTRGLRDYFAPLPGTLSEVSTILNLFDQNKAKAKIEVNKNADEKTIKSGLLKDYRILHFATHGMVHNEKPELSCILLASADSSDTQNDGILYSGEIYNLKLNADLVVLSACETGLGKIKKGEGILGLTRALLYAGSRNIIVSLWQVADQSTSDMMIVFYDDLLKKGLSGSDYSKSLQQAKRYMIKNKQYAHPFYWSPFVLIGK